MKLNDFLEQLNKALNSKTLYVRGGFGAPLNDKNKARYTGPNAYAYNQSPSVKASILNASADTFAFDCVNLIEGILWGWDADPKAQYGGAKYGSNNVPDVSADGMIKLCKNVSTNFKNIKVGEAVWMSGHIGVYIGEGKVIECTAAWENKVIMTNITNVCTIDGMHQRKWTKHGFIPWIEYEDVAPVQEKIKVGDLVNYTGNVHYSNSNALIGKKCVGGIAEVTAIAPTGKHPYHLKWAVRPCNVYGWVDKNLVEKYK